MLVSPHAAVGAAIGALIPNPLVAVPLALGSHYFLDTVLHWQETLAPYTPSKKTYLRISLDIPLALGITTLIAYWNPLQTPLIWAGALAGTLPDLDALLVQVPFFLRKGIIKMYWDWHCKIQNETGEWRGVWPQLAVIALALTVSYGLRFL